MDIVKIYIICTTQSSDTLPLPLSLVLHLFSEIQHFCYDFVIFSQVKLVEVLGRRTLMLYGLGGMFVFYAVMTLSFCFNVCNTIMLYSLHGM